MSTKADAEVALLELESPGNEWCSPDQRRCIGGIIRARMAELEARVPRWIPVSEGLPEHEQIVLYPSSNGHCFPVQFLAHPDRDPLWVWNYEHFLMPSHWMPMPAQPATEEHEHEG